MTARTDQIKAGIAEHGYIIGRPCFTRIAGAPAHLTSETEAHELEGVSHGDEQQHQQ